MSRRSRAALPRSRRPIPDRLRSLLKPPTAIVLGSPAEALHLVADAQLADAVCYQMDLYQAERLQDALADAGRSATVVVQPDLWDLPADFASAVYLPARGGERELKLDMLEQSHHILRPHGTLAVWPAEAPDSFLPPQLKKFFGRASADDAAGVYWTIRSGDRPRRRHEMTFQARIADRSPCRFDSRPGTFSYGRLDNGSRALAEVAEIEPGERVVDLGCGIGVNGIFAAQQCSSTGHVAFVDSNVRALALAELNARANGVSNFAIHASSTAAGPERGTFDVVLANPPYFADHAVSRLFIHRARELLTPQGRFYLVTRQPSPLVEVIEETFGAVEAVLHRGYHVLMA